MFDHMDGIMRAWAEKNTQWKENLYCTVKFVQQKLSRYYVVVTPTTSMLLISADNNDPLRRLQSFPK